MPWGKIGIGASAAAVLAVVIALYVLAGYDYNSLKPQLARAVEDASGRVLTIDGDITFIPGLHPRLSMDRVSLSNVSWSSNPDMAAVERFELQVSLLPLLRREIRIRTLVLERPRFFIEKDSQGRSNLEFSTEQDSETDIQERPEAAGFKLPGITADHILVRDAQVHMLNRQQETEAVYRIDRFEAHAEPDDQLHLKLNMDVNGHGLSVRGRCGSFDAAYAPDSAWELDLQYALAGMHGTLQGAILNPVQVNGVDVRITVQGSDIGTLGKLGAPVIPLIGPFSLAVRLITDDGITLGLPEFSVTLSGSTITGNAQLQLGASPPTIEASIRSDHADLRPVLTDHNPPASEESASREKLFSAKPVSFDALKALDADLDVRVAELKLPWIELDSLAMHVKLAGGVLDVTDIKAVSGQGAAAAHLSVHAADSVPDTSLRADLQNWDLAVLMRGLGSDVFQEALIDLTIDLRCTGSSAADMMAGMDGQIQAVLGPSILHNNSIYGLASDLRAGLFRLLNPAEERGSATTINCGLLVAEIEGGMADVTALVLDTTKMSVKGAGSVDLETERLNITLTPKPKEGLDTKLFGKWSLSLSELARSLKLSGSLAEPRLALDTGRVMITIGRGVIGTLLLGPVGAAATLVGTAASADACLDLLQEDDQEPSPDSSGIGRALESIGDGVREVFK